MDIGAALSVSDGAEDSRALKNYLASGGKVTYSLSSDGKKKVTSLFCR